MAEVERKPKAMRSNQEWKDNFAALSEVTGEDFDPRKFQQIMLDQNANMGKAFTEKTMGMAQERRELQGVKNSLQPHHQRLQRAGISPRALFIS